MLDPSGYPPLLAFLLAILLIDLPLLWGIMLYEGWKQNGRFSLERVVLYREHVSWRKFVVVFIGAFIAAFVLVTLASPLTGLLKEGIFSGMPDWMFLEEQSQYEAYPKNVLVMIFTFQLILTGIVLPWTEELYFRGYLLPRISRYEIGAPLIGGLFFGLYHSWQAFGFVSIFLLGAVLGYVLWWQRDIRLSIVLHIMANAVTRLAFLLAALAL
jgi:membrane protease YdiL (CAAX protease family)